MSNRDTSPPAFPLADSCCEYGGTNRSGANGMTLRDYFAAKAMHASMSADPANEADADSHARWAYEMADSMLKARKA